MSRTTRKKLEPVEKPVYNILVTGGLGFIGHRVVIELMKEGHNVHIVDNMTTYNIIPKEELDYLVTSRLNSIASRVTARSQVDLLKCDIQDSAVSRLMMSKTFDIVIHLASFPRQKVVNLDPKAGSKVMSEGLLHLLELSRKNVVKRFVYISSSMVYGDFKDNVKEDALCDPKGQYAIMKYAGELLVKDYTRQYGLDHTIIRPSAVYGEFDAEDRVVSKFLLSALRDDTLQVNGKMEKLDFTHVGDVAKGIVQASLSDKAKNETYNLTRSKGVTLYDAASMITKITGKGNIKVNLKDKNFPTRGALSITKAKEHFDFNPTVDVEQGFRFYYDWLINSKYWQDKINVKEPVKKTARKKKNV